MGVSILNPSSGFGGTGTASLDFGTPPNNVTTTTTAVTGQAGILSSSKVFVAKRVEATSNHTADEVFVESWEAEVGNVVPEVGFTVYGKSTLGLVNGKLNVSWSWV